MTLCADSDSSASPCGAAWTRLGFKDWVRAASGSNCNGAQFPAPDSEPWLPGAGLPSRRRRVRSGAVPQGRNLSWQLRCHGGTRDSDSGFTLAGSSPGPERRGEPPAVTVAAGAGQDPDAALSEPLRAAAGQLL